jgi:hypothetical protein
MATALIVVLMRGTQLLICAITIHFWHIVTGDLPAEKIEVAR